MPDRINSGMDTSDALPIRKHNEAVTITDEDAAVAQTYPEWRDKGPVTDGRGITVMTKKPTYHVNENARIIHVLEATTPGHKVYVMGPKPVLGEYVNGHLQSPGPVLNEADPFTPTEYDGRVLDSPATDFNFEVTQYTFSQPGTYRIWWQLGKWKSNILEIEVVK